MVSIIGVFIFFYQILFMKQTHAVLADVEKLIKSALIYQGLYMEQYNLDKDADNYEAKREELHKKIEPWAKEFGLGKDLWDNYREISMGEIAINALNLIIDDYEESGMSLEQYARGLRKIYLTPENQQYIYVTPLKIKRQRGKIQNNQIDEWQPPIKIEIKSKELVGFQRQRKKSDVEKTVEENITKESSIELLGLTFPWWGVYKDGEPVTDMLFRGIAFLKDETEEWDYITKMNDNYDASTRVFLTKGGESEEEDEIYMIDGRYYKVEIQDKDLKGIFCFVEEPEFESMCNFYGFPLKEGYTLEEQCFDAEVYERLLLFNFGRCYTREDRERERHCETLLYKGLDYDEVRKSLARLATMGLLGNGLDLLRAKDPEIGFHERLNEIMENNEEEAMLETFRKNYLNFCVEPEDDFFD